MPTVFGSQWEMGSEEKADQKEFKGEVRQSITLDHQAPGKQITDRVITLMIISGPSLTVWPITSLTSTTVLIYTR